MLDGKLQELRGSITMQGGPRLMEMPLSDFLDVVWAAIVTPPPMADAHEWREVMFCWFYLGKKPLYIDVYDPETKKRSKKLASREQQMAATRVDEVADRIARGADDNMERLKKIHAANAERREASRERVRQERLQHMEEPEPG